MARRPAEPGVYRCPVVGCNKWLTRSNCRKRHIMTKHVKCSHWGCPGCSARFYQSQHFTRHVKHCVSCGPEVRTAPHKDYVCFDTRKPLLNVWTDEYDLPVFKPDLSGAQMRHKTSGLVKQCRNDSITVTNVWPAPVAYGPTTNTAPAVAAASAGTIIGAGVNTVYGFPQTFGNGSGDEAGLVTSPQSNAPTTSTASSTSFLPTVPHPAWPFVPQTWFPQTIVPPHSTGPEPGGIVYPNNALGLVLPDPPAFGHNHHAFDPFGSARRPSVSSTPGQVDFALYPDGLFALPAPNQPILEHIGTAADSGPHYIAPLPVLNPGAELDPWLTALLADFTGAEM